MVKSQEALLKSALKTFFSWAEKGNMKPIQKPNTNKITAFRGTTMVTVAIEDDQIAISTIGPNGGELKKEIEDLLALPDAPEVEPDAEFEDGPVDLSGEKPVPKVELIQTPPSLTGFRPAARSAAKLRLGIAGPAGSGKTMSALLIAFGITGNWSKIGLVDTENGSGELYVGTTVNGITIGDYNVLTLQAPYEPNKYIDAINLAEDAGLDLVIVDSLSHAWVGSGGMLDLHGKLTDSSSSKNSWAAWRQVTPKHNQLIEKLLTTKLHVIVTVRSKMAYIQDGKNIVKVGMEPIFRDGIEYELTTFFDMSINHLAVASKDRTNTFAGDNPFMPSPVVGEKLKTWLMGRSA